MAGNKNVPFFGSGGIPREFSVIGDDYLVPVWTPNGLWGAAPPSQIPSGNIFLSATKVAAEASRISRSVLGIQTQGYTTIGDGGGAFYKRAASEPSHAGKFRSRDGAWWELAVQEATPEMFGAALGVDATTPIQSALDYTTAGGVLRFLARTYNISQTLTLNKCVRLVGTTANINGQGTIIRRTADIPVMRIAGTSASYISFGGIEGITFRQSSTAFTTDVVKIEYALGGSVFDMVVDCQTLGAGLYLNAVQDVSFWRLFIRGAGNTGVRGALHLAPPDLINGDINCNDLRFETCHFEAVPGNIGTLLFSEYTSGNGRNNSVVFVNTKFEAGTGNPLIVLQYAERFTFDACRFSQFTSCILANHCIALRIDASVNCTNPPTSFGTFTDCGGIFGTVDGVHSGVATYVRCFGVALLVHRSPATTNLDTRYGMGQAALGTNYLGDFANGQVGNALIDEPTEFCGTAIKGTTGDFQIVLRVRPSPVSRHRDGMTVWIRAKSSAAKNYEVRAKDLANVQDVVVATLNIGTTYAWYRAVFRPNELSIPNMYMQINNGSGMGADFVTISEFYFEEPASFNAVPATGTWEQGAIVRNNTPAAGGNWGWICVAGGTPGTWKAINTIAP